MTRPQRCLPFQKSRRELPRRNVKARKQQLLSWRNQAKNDAMRGAGRTARFYTHMASPAPSRTVLSSGPVTEKPLPMFEVLHEDNPPSSSFQPRTAGGRRERTPARCAHACAHACAHVHARAQPQWAWPHTPPLWQDPDRPQAAPRTLPPSPASLPSRLRLHLRWGPTLCGQTPPWADRGDGHCQPFIRREVDGCAPTASGPCCLSSRFLIHPRGGRPSLRGEAKEAGGALADPPWGRGRGDWSLWGDQAPFPSPFGVSRHKGSRVPVTAGGRPSNSLAQCCPGRREEAGAGLVQSSADSQGLGSQTRGPVPSLPQMVAGHCKPEARGPSRKG